MGFCSYYDDIMMKRCREAEAWVDLDPDDIDEIELGTRKPSEIVLYQLSNDIRRNNLQGVKDYINLDYDVNVSNEYGDSALSLVCENYVLSKKNDLRLIELLLKAEADPKKNRFGNTPIFWCYSKNSSKLLELLLKFDSEVNVKNENGDTPLLVCCAIDNLENVHSLLRAGVDVNVKNNLGDTPLMIAKRHHNDDIVDLLLEYGAKE